MNLTAIIHQGTEYTKTHIPAIIISTIIIILFIGIVILSRKTKKQIDKMDYEKKSEYPYFQDLQPAFRKHVDKSYEFKKQLMKEQQTKINSNCQNVALSNWDEVTNDETGKKLRAIAEGKY